jgi:hypothetical protein
LIQQFTGSFGGRIALLFTEQFSACKRMEGQIAAQGSSRVVSIRLSLFRERLAWGVPQRATLPTPQQDVVNTPREKSVTMK